MLIHLGLDSARLESGDVLEVEMRLMLPKDRLKREERGLRCVANVIGEAGFGVSRMRAVTRIENGFPGPAAMLSVGFEVLRVRPIVTRGFGSLIA